MYYRILALDIGKVRIGIAMSDILQTIASPYESYKRINIIKDIAHIINIAKENDVKVIVVGLPISMDGKQNPQCESINFFVDKLKEKTDISIEYVDERFTTLSANRLLLEADMKRADRKNVVDKVAASFILQNYLDNNRKITK